MHALVRVGGSLAVLVLLLMSPSDGVDAQGACGVAGERTIRSLETLPVPWGGEVDVTPSLVIDCGPGRSSTSLTVTEELPPDVELVPGVGQPPDRTNGRTVSWTLDTSGLGSEDAITFTYRIYLTPDPVLFEAHDAVEIDWPMDLELVTDSGVERPPGPETDPLVVVQRPGARECARSVDHQVKPESVWPGEPFEVTVSVWFDRCRRPSNRHRAMVVVQPPTDVFRALDMRNAMTALVRGVQSADPGSPGQVGVVFNSATGAQTVLPTVDRDVPPDAAYQGFGSGPVSSADAATGLNTALSALTDWPDHHEIVYVLTHADAPIADAGDATRALAAASAAGVEVVPICIAGGCDPAFTYAAEAEWGDALESTLGALPRQHRGALGDVRGFEIEEWIPPHLMLVPGSVKPPGVVEADRIVWSDLRLPVSRRMRLKYRVAAQTWGRFPVGSPSYLRYQDEMQGQVDWDLLLPGFVSVKRDLAMDHDPCHMFVDKTALPQRLYLGSAVTVTLKARPYCHDVAERLHVVLSLDRSASMGTRKNEFGYVKLAARSLAEMLAVDVGGDRRFGLVSHGTRPVVDVPLSNDLESISAAIDRILARGGDHVPLSIEMGAELLRGARNPSGEAAKDILVVLTDGGQSVTPPSIAIPAAEAAKADGITVVSICAVSAEARCDVVRELASDPSLYFEVRSVHEVLSAFVDIGVQLRQKPLGHASIVDDLPPHMRLVHGSAEPPLDSASGQRLIWRVDQLPPTGMHVSYLATPLLIGKQLTNSYASIGYEDVLGIERSQTFPVPSVRTFFNQLPNICAARVRHTASPATVEVGQPVSVTLAVTSDCPPVRSRLDVVLAMDRSESMRQLDRMENAKLAVDAFLDSLSPNTARVGLVVFDSHIANTVPLTHDFDVVRAAVHALYPRGNTDIEPALREADRLLGDGGEDRDGDALIVLLTDGMTLGSVDDMRLTAQQITERGVLLATVCAGTCDPVLPTLASRPDMAFQVADSAVLIDLFRTLMNSIRRPFPHDIAIDLTLSPLVEPMRGSFSLQPAAINDASGSVRWLPPDMVTETLSITYAIRPVAAGRIPVGLAKMSFSYAGSPARPAQAMVPVVDVTGGSANTPTPLLVPSATPTLRPTSTPIIVPGSRLWLPALLQRAIHGSRP